MKTFMIALLVLFASIFTITEAGELYNVKWYIPIDQRAGTLSTFGKMTEAHDLADAGNVTLHHRYTKMGGNSGFAIIEAESQVDVLSFMLNWAPACDIEVTPIVSDVPCREAIREVFGLATDEEIGEAFNDEIDNDGKVYKVEWSIPVENREHILPMFGGMTAQDDLDQAEKAGDVKLIGRWAELGGKSGLALFQADNHKDVLKFMLPWTTSVELNVVPVIADGPTRNVIQDKAWFA